MEPMQRQAIHSGWDRGCCKASEANKKFNTENIFWEHRVMRNARNDM